MVPGLYPVRFILGFPVYSFLRCQPVQPFLDRRVTETYFPANGSQAGALGVHLQYGFVFGVVGIAGNGNAALINIRTGGATINFDKNNNLWLWTNHQSKKKLQMIDPNSGNVLYEYDQQDLGIPMNGIAFDSNNHMHLIANDGFTVIDPVDNIFFNNNDIVSSYLWPFGRIGTSGSEMLGGDFDSSGNLLVPDTESGGNRVFVLDTNTLLYSSFLTGTVPHAIRVT